MPQNSRITIDELKTRMEKGEDFAIVETRNPQAWSESHVMIPEAIRVSVDEFEEHVSEIPKNKPIVTYCT